MLYLSLFALYAAFRDQYYFINSILIRKPCQKSHLKMDFQDIIDNNLKDHLIVSEIVEESFKDVELVLGIDEAGRGPVLGKKKLLMTINSSSV